MTPIAKILVMLATLLALNGCVSRQAAQAHAAYMENVAEINTAIAERKQKPILRLEAADGADGINLVGVKSLEVYDPNAQPDFVRPEAYRAPTDVLGVVGKLAETGLKIYAQKELGDTVRDVVLGVADRVAEAPGANNSINVGGNYGDTDQSQHDSSTTVGGNFGDTDNSTDNSNDAGRDIIIGDQNNNQGRFESPGDFDNDETDNDGTVTNPDPPQDPDPDPPSP